MKPSVVIPCGPCINDKDLAGFVDKTGIFEMTYSPPTASIPISLQAFKNDLCGGSADRWALTSLGVADARYQKKR